MITWRRRKRYLPVEGCSLVQLEPFPCRFHDWRPSIDSQNASVAVIRPPSGFTPESDSLPYSQAHHSGGWMAPRPAWTARMCRSCEFGERTMLRNEIGTFSMSGKVVLSTPVGPFYLETIRNVGCSLIFLDSLALVFRRDIVCMEH